MRQSSTSNSVQGTFHNPKHLAMPITRCRKQLMHQVANTADADSTPKYTSYSSLGQQKVYPRFGAMRCSNILADL